jgi:dihydrodiol dehydrogenase / D-xylose 1-dehydrogenase (NADP)
MGYPRDRDGRPGIHTGPEPVPYAVLASVSSRRPDRAREFAGRFGARRAHDTLDQLVRDDEVDVIYVATHHLHHRQHAVACLEAGKAVLCEKPFALNAAETGQIVDQARCSRRFCMEAMWMRFHPLILSGPYSQLMVRLRCRGV